MKWLLLYLGAVGLVILCVTAWCKAAARAERMRLRALMPLLASPPSAAVGPSSLLAPGREPDGHLQPDRAHRVDEPPAAGVRPSEPPAVAPDHT